MELAIVALSVVCVFLCLAIAALLAYVIRTEQRHERVSERLLDRLTAALGKEAPMEDTSAFLASAAALRNGPPKPEPPKPAQFNVEAFMEHAHRTGMTEQAVRDELVKRGVLAREL